MLILKMDSFQALPIPTTIQRKKSLPDVQALPKATEPMSREEVSALGSARREEIRRQIDEKEKLRANPLLYLVSPQVKVTNFEHLFLTISKNKLEIILLKLVITSAILFQAYFFACVDF